MSAAFRLLLLLVAVGLLLQLDPVAAVHSEVANGFFGGRSGDALLFQGIPSPAQAGALGFQSSLPAAESLVAADLSHDTQSTPISQVFDVLARALGLPPRAATPNHLLNPMAPRKALPTTVDRSVLLSLPGVDPAELREFTPSLAQELLQTPLVDPSTPRTAVAQAATLATGTLPREHGIVGPTWRNPSSSSPLAFVRAFSDTTAGAAGLRRTTSLADQVARHNGAALSFSSDRQLSLAHCVSPGASQRLGGSAKILCASLDTGGGIRDLLDGQVILRPAGLFQAIVDAVEGRSELFAPLLNAEPGLPARLSLRRSSPGEKGFQALVVHLRDGSVVEFDVSNAQDLALLAELVGADLFIRSRLPATSGMAHLAVSFAAPSSFRGDEEKFHASLLLVEAIVPGLRKHLEAATSHASYLLAFVVAGRTHETSADLALLREELPEAARRMLASYPELSLPQLYLRSDQQIEEFCRIVSDFQQKRQRSSSSSQAQFVCVVNDPEMSGLRQASMAEAQEEVEREERRATHAMLMQQQILNSQSGGVGFPEISNATMVDIRRYQIAMWFSIGMAFVVVFTAYAVANMSFRKDTLLYGGVQADIAVRGS